MEMVIHIVLEIYHWVQENETLLWISAVGSVLTVLGTVLLAPVVIIRIPRDYFSGRAYHHLPWAQHHPVIRVVLILAKNLLGLIFVVAGIAMLVLPGQGLLTILAGVLLLNFPGKVRLERRIVAYPPLYRSINWLRRRYNRPPLEL